MKRLFVAAALVTAFGAPAFAQMEVTCGDYSLMDNAKQMETLAALELQAKAEAGTEFNMSAEAMHEKLAAECKDKVDVLIIDVVKGK